MINFKTLVSAFCLSIVSHAASYQEFDEAKQALANYRITVCQAFNGSPIRSLEVVGFAYGGPYNLSKLKFTYGNGKSELFDIYDSGEIFRSRDYYGKPTLSELNARFGIDKSVKFISGRRLTARQTLNAAFIITTDEKGTQYLLHENESRPQLVGLSKCNYTPSLSSSR